MKNFRPPFHVDFHSERGEVTIYVTDADGQDVWYADTDTVNQLVEDGFISTRGFAMGRNMRPDVLERSVLDYLREVGVIPPGRMPDDHSLGDFRDDLYSENPRRRNPGDVHIDIHSHNTRGRNPVIAKTRDTIFFTTDREYTMGEKQTIVAWVVGREESAGGFDFMRVRFWDFSRQVGGEIYPVMELHPREIMNAYDSGHYHSVYISGDEIDRASGGAGGKRRPNPTQTDVKSVYVLIKNAALANRYAKESAERIARRFAHLSADDAVARFNELVSAPSREQNPTQTDVDGWVDRYRASVNQRVDGVPERQQYIIKVTTKKDEVGYLRVGKGSKIDSDINSARVYRSGDKANEAATKVANWLKKKHPAKWKAIKSISAEPKK